MVDARFRRCFRARHLTALNLAKAVLSGIGSPSLRIRWHAMGNAPPVHRRRQQREMARSSPRLFAWREPNRNHRHGRRFLLSISVPAQHDPARGRVAERSAQAICWRGLAPRHRRYRCAAERTILDMLPVDLVNHSRRRSPLKAPAHGFIAPPPGGRPKRRQAGQPMHLTSSNPSAVRVFRPFGPVPDRRVGRHQAFISV